MAVDPPYRMKNMVPGMIMLWYGSIASIPSGWALCDGTNNTPNLNGKFVRCAGAGFAVDGIGGSSNHVHTFTGDGHSHDLVEGTYIEENSPVGDYGHTTNSSPATGTTNSTDHKPPYHTLCYIMKLPIP